MKFTSTVATTILGLAATLSAFPVLPTLNYPATNSIYRSLSKTVHYDTDHGMIFSAPGDIDDVSTLVMFYFYPSAAGKTCEFNFDLEDKPGNPGGDQVLAVYQSRTDIMSNTTLTEQLSDFRDHFFGWMRTVSGGQAKPEAGISDLKSFQFPCPAPVGGQSVRTVTFEVVPVNLNTNIQWSKQHGPWVNVLTT